MFSLALPAPSPIGMHPGLRSMYALSLKDYRPTARLAWLALLSPSCSHPCLLAWHIRTLGSCGTMCRMLRLSRLHSSRSSDSFESHIVSCA